MSAHDDARPLSRRRLVQALVLGAGAAGAAAASATTGTTAGPLTGRGESGRLVLSGQRFRTVRLGKQPGALPERDMVPATSGELLLEDGALGSFSAAAVPGSQGRFVLHSFDLGDGLLLGMGSGALAEGAYAVVGGTGRYAGAVGSYTAAQSPSDLGGDGSARFEFTLTPTEV